MKIAVCLPSLNEVITIGNLTKVVDKGLLILLQKYTDFQAEILNFDSNSTDGTVSKFLDTETMTPKRSFITRIFGKGKNIFEFCKYVIENNIDYCLSIDSDITSATPSWIITLIEPLLLQRADYVTPIYKRSRYEGSSTNHFAFPVIYALTGCVVRQPIAGDFAFTNKIAKEFIKDDLFSADFINHYGIDIFMTLAVIRSSGKIVQVNLDRKIHAPSFHKLEYMFPQIAAAALMSFKEGEFFDNNQSIEPFNDILSDIRFAHKIQALEMKDRAFIVLSKICSYSWISHGLINKYINTLKLESTQQSEILELWVDILTSWIIYHLKNTVTIDKAVLAGKELLPFFVLRVVNFWFWAELVGEDEVEKVIQEQAKKLKDKVKIL